MPGLDLLVGSRLQFPTLWRFLPAEIWTRQILQPSLRTTCASSAVILAINETSHTFGGLPVATVTHCFWSLTRAVASQTIGLKVKKRNNSSLFIVSPITGRLRIVELYVLGEFNPCLTCHLNKGSRQVKGILPPMRIKLLQTQLPLRV